MSTIVSLAEAVEIERMAGSTDEQLVRLLNSSRIAAPDGGRWDEQKLVAEFGERIKGLTRR